MKKTFLALTTILALGTVSINSASADYRGHYNHSHNRPDVGVALGLGILGGFALGLSVGPQFDRHEPPVVYVPGPSYPPPPPPHYRRPMTCGSEWTGHYNWNPRTGNWDPVFRNYCR